MSTALNSYIFGEVIGFPGNFDSFAGGECQQNMTDYVPGGERSARKIPGTFSYSDITMMRAWDPLKDGPIVAWARRCIVDGIKDPKVVVKYTRNVQGVIEDKKSYQVVPRNYKTPDGKSGDDGIAEFTIVLSVEKEL